MVFLFIQNSYCNDVVFAISLQVWECKKRYIQVKLITMKQSTITSSKLDFLGFWASTLCAIHCAASPLLITLSALGGLTFLAEPSIEGLVIVVSMTLALLSLIPSWRKHRRWEMIALALLGFTCIALGHELGHELESIYLEAVLASLGGIAVASAHWWNAKSVKKIQ